VISHICDNPYLYSELLCTLEVYMSEEIPKWAEQLIREVSEIHSSAFRSECEITELKKQVGINCNKLDSMDKKLDSIVNIVTANGQGIEVISERVDKLEK